MATIRGQCTPTATKRRAALDDILARAAALASSPEEKQRIEGYRQRLQVVKDFQAELSTVSKNSAIEGLKNALNDIVTGAKSGKEALLDMVRSFAMSILDVLNKRLAQMLVDQAIKAAEKFRSTSGSSGGGGGGINWAAIVQWFASLFHSGGIVGEGSAPGRAVPAFAFVGAPRYHAGGIAGLGSNEVPAVLLAGEEVLTQDDPRHRNNLARSRTGPAVGAVNIAVSVEGSGSELGRADGERLGRSLRVAVEGVIADEMRPGGMLYRS